MLANVNSNYEPSITVEDIQNRVRKMSRFKASFVILVVLVTILQVPIIVSKLIFSPIFTMLEIVNLVIFIIFSAVFGIAFVLYGRKVMSLMPDKFQKEVKSITWKVTTFCWATFATSLIFVVYSFIFTSPFAQMIFVPISATQQYVVTAIIFSIYADFDLKRRIVVARNYVMPGISSDTDRKKSSATSPTSDDTAEDTVEVEVRHSDTE